MRKYYLKAEGEDESNSTSSFRLNQQQFLARVKQKKCDRNRRRICSQTLSLASQLNETTDPIEASKLSGALAVLAVASGFQDDALAERLIKAANRLTGGGL
jgi:hypothetical protein